MPVILWVEDDPFLIQPYKVYLESQGYRVECATNATDGLLMFETLAGDLQAVIVDMAMAPGERFSEIESHGGFTAGLAVARNIRLRKPGLAIIALTHIDNPQSRAWFEENGLAFLLKGRTSPAVLHQALMGTAPSKLAGQIQCFIVHGHDDGAVEELKSFLQRHWRMSNPVVLREMPNHGMTVIEKLERHTADAFIAFVLLTPDDAGRALRGGPEGPRARQNVIFELGYFFGRMGRRDGRVIVLAKGKLDLPSDILGVLTINVSAGMEAAKDQIIREAGRVLGPPAA